MTVCEASGATSVLRKPKVAEHCIRENWKWEEGDSHHHLSLNTSCRWPASLRSGMIQGVLTSRWRISLSLEPEESTSPFQASAPTRAVWPFRMHTRLLLATSHTCTSPLCVPTATWLPCKSPTHSYSIHEFTVGYIPNLPKPFSPTILSHQWNRHPMMHIQVRVLNGMLPLPTPWKSA